jgi:hypothetical protein
MMRSPLIVGANLTLLDDETLKLLTNPALIALDQYGAGGGRIEPPLEKYDERLPKPIPGLQVWGSTLKATGGPDTHCVALFNLSDAPVHVSHSLADLNLVRNAHRQKSAAVADVWNQRELGFIDHIDTTIPPHGVVLLMSR